MRGSGLTAKAAVKVWLAVMDIVGAITVWEIGAEQGVWGPTISQFSYLHQLAGWVIFLGFCTLPVWWWFHFHKPHPR